MKAWVTKWLARIQTERLSRRERKYLMAAAALTAALLVYGIFSAASGYMSRMKSLDRLIAQKREAMAHLAQIREEHERLQKRVGDLNAQMQQDKGRFSLLSFLEAQSGAAGIRSQIAYMRPQAVVLAEPYRETSVEMKIDNLSLDQAVRFLSSIEQSPHVLRIKNLHFRTRYANPQYLDLNFLVSAYDLSGG